MSEGIDVEYTVKGGDYDGRKLYSLPAPRRHHGGARQGRRDHARCCWAIYEAVNAIDPNDTSPEADTRRNSSTLAGFNGATFLATQEVEVGGKRSSEQGGGNYRDKNMIGKVLRVGDKGYCKLDQPPPMPIERSAPPAAASGGAPGGTPPVSPTAIEPPHWAR